MLTQTQVDLIRDSSNSELIEAIHDISMYKVAILKELDANDVALLQEFFPFQTGHDGSLSVGNAMYQIRVMLEQYPMLKGRNKDIICLKLKAFFTLNTVNSNKIFTPNWANFDINSLINNQQQSQIGNFQIEDVPDN